jgi:hypothetical protein
MAETDCAPARTEQSDRRWIVILTRLRQAHQLVLEQAKDEGLWFIAETAPEAYLQQELRRLHEAIERIGAV